MRRYNINSTIAVTLAELLIATSLILLVLIVVASLDFAARRFYSDAEKATTALNDITLAMEYMARESDAAIGDVVNPAFQKPSTLGCPGGGNDSFMLRKDINQNGRIDLPAENFNIEFCYSPTAHTITLNPSGNIIATRVTGFDITPVGNPVSEIRIILMARDNPAIPASPKNPEVNIQSSAYLRAASAR